MNWFLPSGLLVAWVLSFISPAAWAQEPTQPWTALFNGKDLTGWKIDPKQPGRWKVVDGAIVGTGGATSHLFSDRGDFDSFHLRTVAKISPTGNSGVFFCSEFGLSPKEYPSGYEAQIYPGGGKEDQLTGSLYGLAPVKERLVEPNQWFVMEVTKDGRFITIKVNGRTSVRFKDEKNSYTKGHFALQQVAGTTVAFRRIDVLDPCPAQWRALPNAPSVPLCTFWHEDRKDVATVATLAMKKTLANAGYIYPEITGRVVKAAAPGTAPLLLFKRADGREHLTVRTEAGKQTAKDTGYVLIGEQGHVYTEPRWGTVPLNLYWNPDRKDYFTCSSEYPRERPEAQGYEFVRTEGYVIPAWRNQPRPWAILLCKFKDKANFEPHPASFYKEGLTEAGAGKGRAFDYFRDVSNGGLDLTGSKVFGWMTLDQRAQDLNNHGSGFRGELHALAIKAAKAQGIDLTPFWGVAAFFNHNTDGGAFGFFGGPMCVVLGGAEKQPWEPSVVCHELGHGFGFQHAHLAHPFDDYGDGYDIMGNWGSWGVKTPVGGLGPGFHAQHLKQAGCLPADRIWTANPTPASYTLTLAALNKFDAEGFLMASIPPAPGSAVQSTHWLEFRRKTGWDAAIPQDTVLVHELRGDFDSYLLSRKKGYDQDAIKILPGQTFEVPLRDLTIKVESFDLEASTAKVTIKIGKPGELTRKLTPVTEFLIVNAQSGRVLDAATPYWLGDGVPVRLWSKTGNANQRWNVFKESKATVTIANVADGRLLDAQVDQLDRDGTSIALYGIDTKERLNRVWKMVPLGKGEVAIVNAESGRYLDADLDMIDRDGTKVRLFGKDAAGMPNRRWKLVPIARWPGTAPNLLVNGSFEDCPAFADKDDWFELRDGSEAIRQWKVTGSLLITGKLWEHADGTNSLLLHSPDRRGGIEQTFATKKGQRYRVTFALSANPNNGRWKPEETTTAIRVSAAGKSQRFAFDCAGKLPDNMGWTIQKWEFIAKGDRTTLAFQTEETDKGFWHGPALDDAWVEAVPWQ